jgi:hypothetical protein
MTALERAHLRWGMTPRRRPRICSAFFACAVFWTLVTLTFAHAIG